MKLLKKFLFGAIVAIFAIFLSTPGYCIFGDIGDYGSWATDENRELFIGNTMGDINSFKPKDIVVDTYVPIEAKIGMAFMNAFSYVANVLDISLVRFVIIFILIAYAFWIAAEAYLIIKGESKAQDKFLEILKRGITVFMWIMVLSYGPVKLFMLVISPILFLGSEISDLILNSTTQIAGVSLPDTCSAIYNYVTENISNENIMDAANASSIMCIPTRLSGFCYTAASVGWSWIALSIGNSLFGFVCGVAFVGAFIYLAWRYAFMAFGIIADLFLAIILLPFTAVTECVSKTSYKGIGGQIYNGFLELFKAEKLSAQVERFINAALFFVVLSVVISISAALLSTVVNLNSPGELPTINSSSFWMTALVLGLTFWFAKGAEKIAADIGGKVSYEMGDELKKETKKFVGNANKTAQGWWKAIRGARKK